MTEEIITVPRFNIKSKKGFTKGSSLVFILLHYGMSLGDAKYKTEKFLHGDSINVNLPEVQYEEQFLNDIKKLDLSAELVNQATVIWPES